MSVGCSKDCHSEKFDLSSSCKLPVSSNRSAATEVLSLVVDQRTVPFGSETVIPAGVSVNKPELDVGAARLPAQRRVVVGT